jgi:hypothetical protein
MMANEEIEGFTKYIKRGRTTVPKVTVRKNGVLAFNSAAVQRYVLDTFKYAVFYVSNNKNRVAVKFTNNEKESGIIKIQQRLGNYQISATHFFGINDIDRSENVNYDFVWSDKTHVAIFRPKFIKRKIELVKADDDENSKEYKAAKATDI